MKTHFDIMASIDVPEGKVKKASKLFKASAFADLICRYLEENGITEDDAEGHLIHVSSKKN